MVDANSNDQKPKWQISVLSRLQGIESKGSVSKKDAYPLPYMNSILDKLRSTQYISTIDLSQTYFQVPLEKKQSRAYRVYGSE